MRNAHLILLVFTELWLAACHQHHDPQPAPPIWTAGVYVGQFAETHKGADPTHGSYQHDTAYVDTFKIVNLGSDSLAVYQRGAWLGAWRRDTASTHYSWYGSSHTNRTFVWKSPDSLHVDYWTYSGIDAYHFAQTTSTFRGKKLP